MNLLEAVVLGLVQGITEFLPISSTAHLRIAPELFGWGDPGAAYSAVIQLGTVAAVVIYFWRDVLKLGAAFFRGIADRKPFGTPESRLAWFVLLGTVPVCIGGLLFKRSIETSLRSLYIIAVSLMVLAVILFFIERTASHQRGMEQMTVKDALIIGCWQALALIPGSSRSGTTLAGGLSLSLKREDAARYSFLLSIPATALAGLFELRHLLQAKEHVSALSMGVGTGVAFVSGMVAIAGLLRYLRRRTTLVFVAYRLALGGALLALLFSGRLQPRSGQEEGQARPPRAQMTDQRRG